MEFLWTAVGICPAVGSMQRWKVRDLAAIIKQLAKMEDKRMQQNRAFRGKVKKEMYEG